MPEQLLQEAVAAVAVSVLDPVPAEPTRCVEPEYFHDLNLDQLVASITAGFDDPDLVHTFRRRAGDLATIAYRQEVFADLDRAGVVERLERFAIQMRRMRSQLVRMDKVRYAKSGQWWFLTAVRTYGDAVRDLCAGLREAQVRSDALTALVDFLDRYTSSASFDELVHEGEAVRESLGSVAYCLHIDGNRIRVSRFDGQADYGAEVLATFEKFRQGDSCDHLAELRESELPDHVEAGVLDRVARLFPQTFEALERFRVGHADYLDPTIEVFDREMQFYLAYHRFTAALIGDGLSFCLPAIAAERKEMYARDTFDLALASRLHEERTPVVTNEFHLRDAERIIVVTGPNQGGKTTLARTVGQLHHLALLGCPVPGSAAQLYLCDEILTHFEKEEDLDDLSGKLKDDVVRIHDLLDRASARSLLVLNEIFSSTALEDARLLGGRVLQRVADLDAFCVCVTFIDELASLNDRVVSMVSTVVPEDPAERTYRVVRQRADGRAYAIAIADKYRLGYDTVRRRVAR